MCAATPSAPLRSHRATWRRSVGLFRAFLSEQSAPDRFYGELAQDSARHVDQFHRLQGTLLLDVGGGPGFFADAFAARGATYVAVDADAGEMRLHGREPGPRAPCWRVVMHCPLSMPPLT